MKMPSLKIAAALTSFLFILSLVPVSAFASASPGSVQKISDPDTSSSWQSLFDISSSADADNSYSTEESGRIWIDKSVYTDESSAAASGIPETSMEDPTNDFLVGLSTISASSTIQKETPFSHDVVFIVSLNSAMASLNYDGKPYAAHIADALNESIGRLMDENANSTGTQPKSRIAVVGYSVDVTVLMPLDSYTPDENGNYVVFSNNLAEGGSGLQPVATPATPGIETKSEVVRGSAYLQRAISEASSILQQGANTASADQPRKPELVVMGAAVPLMANTNIANPPVYVNETAEQDGFVGSMPANHNSIGFGTDAAFATLLTIQHEQQAIDNAYAQANEDSASGGSLDMWTVGLDTTGMAAYVLQTASEQESAKITDTVGTTTVDLTDNLKQARISYAQAAAAGDQSVNLSLYGTGTGGIKSETIAFTQPINGLLSADNDYAFDGASDYYLATDAGALSGGFSAAVDRILGIQYNSPVNEGEGTASDSSDRLRIQDNIGDLMNVKRIQGILYQGNLLDGSKAAQAMSASFADPWDVESYHEVDYIMNSLNTRYNLGWDAYSLLYDAYSDGQFAYRGANDYSNYVSWFVDPSHAMVKTGSAGYTFASNEVLAAAKTGDWKNNATPSAKASIEAAVAAGASSVCQTYFYIGNIESQYTGDDVPLYDFVVMVETNLETGNQQLLLTIPADSIPARKAYVTEHLDESASMTLDSDAESTVPLRLVYEVGPRESVTQLTNRIASGEEVTSAEIEEVLGSSATKNASGQYLLYTNAFEGNGTSAVAETVMSAVAASTNSYYSFTQDTPLYTLAAGTDIAEGQTPDENQLVPLESAPEPGQTYYFLDTYYQANNLEFGTEVPAEAVTSVEAYTTASDSSFDSGSFFQSANGQYSVKKGTPKYIVSAMLEDYAKSPNATASVPYVKQISVSDYSSLGRPLLSARLGNNGTFAITPTQKTGSLTVKKHVETQSEYLPLLPADSDHAFNFEVAFTDAEGNALSGAIPFSTNESASEMIALNNGAATFSLKDGESATFESLPEGTRYTVKEANDGGFAASYSITTNGSETASGSSNETEEQSIVEGESAVSFTNTKQGGSLTLTKQVAGNDADPSKSFSFEVKLTDENDNPLQGQFAYGLFQGQAPSNWDAWSLGTATTDENGVLSLENDKIALANGQSIAICGLPVGSKYQVQESANDGYSTSVSKTSSVQAQGADSESSSGTITENEQIDSLTFLNEKWAYGSLTLTKHAYGASEDEQFGFSITLKDAEGNSLSGSYPVSIDSAESTQVALDEHGSLSIELADNQTATIEDIPQGTSYQITETNISSDYLVLNDGAEGTIGSTTAAANFTNIKKSGALAIVNIIGGNSGDKNTPCTYEITIENLFSPTESGTKSLPAEKYDSAGNSSSMTIDFSRYNDTNTGIATVSGVEGSEGILITKLPSSAKFTVTETNAGELENKGYTVSSGLNGNFSQNTNTVEGTVETDAVTAACFLNVKNEYGSLTITKKISGDAAEDEAKAEAGRTFSFAVNVTDSKGAPLSGTFDAEDGTGAKTSILFENGTASFSLAASPEANGSTLTINGLPAGASYSVSEQDESASGYLTSSTDTQGTIVGNSTSVATFTNTKSYTPLSMPIGGLEVLKGKAAASGDFVFQLFEEDGTTPVYDADGNAIVAVNRSAEAGVPVSFLLKGLQITQPGEHRYVVKESIPSGTEPLEGVTYDTTAFTVTISAKASATGKLSLDSLSYSVGSEPVFGINFVNEYRSTGGSFTLKAQKELSDATLADGEFAFYAQEIDPVSEVPLGAPMVARNTADGSIEFPSLQASTPLGSSTTRAFLLSESLPPSATADNGYTASGISYDTAQYLIVVTGQSKSGSNTLEFSSTVSKRTIDSSGDYGPWQKLEGTGGLAEDTTLPVFSNTHISKPASTSFDGHVRYLDETGSHPLEDGMFKFSITAVGENSESAPLPSALQVANTAGAFSFGPIDIPYSEDLIGQTFTYEVRQVIPEGAQYSSDGTSATLNGMTYDARVETVTLTIGSRTAEDGALIPEVTISYSNPDGSSAEALEFFNSYHEGYEPSGPAIPSTPNSIENDTNGKTPNSPTTLNPTGDPLSYVIIGIAAILVGSFALAVYAHSRKRK